MNPKILKKFKSTVLKAETSDLLAFDHKFKMKGIRVIN